MKDFKYIWIIGLVFTALIILTPLVLLVSGNEQRANDPWEGVPPKQGVTDHTKLMMGPFATGQDVTRACLECHEDAGQQMLQTVHWTWETDPMMLPGRDEPVTVGKKNQINNFCIGVPGNWKKCTSCHAGYGWEDNSFDFTDEESVDCLVCHADPNQYAKSNFGNPADGVDLLGAAQSVGRPSRQNCGSCHFNGGGGNAVKHGDLDESLYFPDENIDVHMGRHDFVCVDCHTADDHQIQGFMMSSSPIPHDPVECADCHTGTVHDDERITDHLDTVACQTCHIPEGAVRTATKMDWDWSTAGQDLAIDDPHVYLKIKGSFVYEEGFKPTYEWFNGNSGRYILGDVIDPTQNTLISWPEGSIDDATSKIWPFKVHQGNQPYDLNYKYFLIPNTAGEGGYWTDFDWDYAFASNQENSGLAYSGEYGFAPSRMYWITTHMVQPKEKALQCNDCHSENGRMDWEALGYYGDPMRWGGRTIQPGGEIAAGQ
jgi:octaheme c-type cytochrome (tetrathionate reductase family)